MPNRLPNIPIICLITWLTSTCTHDTIYQSIIQLPKPIWNATECVSFAFQIQDNTQPYNLRAIISSTPDYPYQNLYVTYYLTDTTQQLHKSELVNTLLFDAETGKPMGKGWRQAKRCTNVILENYYFPQAGWYTLQLVQYMRTDALNGIQAIGIQVQKAA